MNGDFDGNHAVYSFANTDTTKANAGVTTTGGTLSNFSVIGEKMGNKGFRALYVTSLTEDLYLENVDLEGTYAMNVNASGITAYGIYAENSTFNGWTSYGSAKEVVFTNCSFGEAEGYANLRPYATTTLEGCDFAEGFTITRDAKDANTFTIALNNCTVDGVAVTADNFAALLGGDLLSSNSLATSANITVLVDGAAVNWNTDTVTFVSDLASLQDALNNTVEGDNIIYLTNDIAGDVVATQKANVNTVIEGAGHTFAGVLTVDGKSGTILTAGLTINNVKFSADSVSADACVRLGDGTKATRYVCNVTLVGCTFDVPNVVGVKSYTGGDKNISIVNCTATERAHSLAQLKGVDGVLVDNCTVNSVRGINLNNSNNVVINKSTFDVEKYAVRFGESANTIVENYTVTYCKLTSDCVDGDAVIVLRAGATNANLDLTGTTLNGSIEMTGYENANIVR